MKHIAKEILFNTIIFMCIFGVFIILLISSPAAALQQESMAATVITTEPTIEYTEPETEDPTPPPTLSLEEQYFQPYTYKEFSSKLEIEMAIVEGKEYLNSIAHLIREEVIDNEINRINSILQKYEEDFMWQKLYETATFKSVPSEYNKRDFKSYENYTCITSKTSPHYKLQRQYAYTGNFGIRMVDGRYCIALGSYFTTTIGQYIDIVLKNGVVIPCILGDQKSDAHTDKRHIAHRTDKSIVEFIVDKNKLPHQAKIIGNISYCCDEWQSPVVQIIIYDKNFFTE